MRKFWKIPLALFCFIIMIGCWDRVEIEERGFIVGAAMEVPKKNEHDEDQEETKDRPKGKQRYALTYQYVMAHHLVIGESHGGQKDTFQNVTSTGDSLFEITREISTRRARAPFLEHLKVILVSEDLADNEGDFANALDFFIRYNEIRRNTKVYIVKGSPAKALGVDPQSEKLPADYIESTSNNHLLSARILKPLALGLLQENLLLETSYAIPRITVEQDEVKSAGAAVFHAEGNRMIGWLGEEETQGLNYLVYEVKGDVIKAQVGDNIIAYDLLNMDRKIKVVEGDKEEIHFIVELDVLGQIAESLETMNYIKQDAYMKVQKSVEDEIIRLCEATIHKLRDEFKVDALGAGTYLKRYQPEVWDRVKKDWDTGENHFSKIKIDVEVNAIVRNPGIMSESESQY